MEIQERLSKYLDELEKAVSTAAEFSAEQAPQVVQEFLAWEFWSSVAGAVFAILMIAVGIFVIRYAWKVAAKVGDPEGVIRIPTTVCGVGLIVGMVVMFAFEATDALKVTIAPRIVLLEKVAEMVKK